MSSAEAEGAMAATKLEKTADSSGYSDPFKNILAGGFGGICLVAAGQYRAGYRKSGPLYF